MLNSTFVVIMGAGRCGSTFVMNKLNEVGDTNIFGEDMGSTLCLLNLLFRLNHRTNHIYKHPLINCSTKTVSSELIGRQISKNSQYLGNEFYHDAQFHNNIKTCNEKWLLDCFSSTVTGFKEIRWDLFADIYFLNVLNQYYRRVVYVNLTRDVDQIICSSIRAFNVNKDEKTKQQIRARILHKQQIIHSFIESQNPSNVISGDITVDCNLIDKINHLVHGSYSS